MPAAHEQAWAEALAQEHLHQHELLAVLRDELGTFARECASALAALDALIGLAGVTEILTTAETSYAHARLVLDVGRRLGGAEDPELVDLYTKVAGGEDVPPALVRHASDLLASGPKRSDRDLLQAVVRASGASAQVEQLLGPAPWAAFSAMTPLAEWLHGRGEAKELAGDLTQVLDATAALGLGESAAAAADASALGDSLREAAEHVEGAARAVREGKLDAVLREARETLQRDLDSLGGIRDSPEATAEWRAARKTEHAELTEEVREKLEKIERIRAVLLRLLPNLQAIARALGVVRRVRSLEERLDAEPAAGVAAGRATLVADIEALIEAISARRTPRARRVRGRRLAVAAVLAAAAAAGLAIALSGGSSKPKPIVTEAQATPAAPATTAAGAPKKPELSGVLANFDPAQRATFYSVAVGSPESVTYHWSLTPPKDNPRCNKFGPVPGHPNQAVWHHADTDGCTHIGVQHDGTVHVRVTTAHWSCTESFFGTLTRVGTGRATCTEG